MRTSKRLAVLAWALAALGCNGGTGRVQVFVEPEDTIPNGLDPGTGEENIHDGWTVRYQKFLVAMGHFRAARSNGTDRLTSPDTFVIDLKNTPAGGWVMAQFEDAPAVRFDRVGFDLVDAASGILRAEGTSPADVDFMATNRYSLYVEGTLTRADGQSCSPTQPADCVPRTSLTFRWGLSAGTSFDDCAPESGAAGFAVPAGGTVQVKPTLHGDHWFFSNITQGAEVTERRAQWVVDADTNRDGETTLDELKNIQAANVFPSPPYNLSGALIPVRTAYDYLEAQARTLGDFQGDGECPTRAVLKDAL